MAWNLSTGMKRGLLGLTAPFGSLAELLDHSVIRIYSNIRVSSADVVESENSGTLLLEITLNGDTFTGGSDTNGLNMELDGITTTLKRAIDAATSNTEIWKGTGLAEGTAGWARWYANPYTTGASTSAVRMDGTVSASGADVNMANGTSIETGVDSEVTDVTFTMSAG